MSLTSKLIPPLMLQTIEVTVVGTMNTLTIVLRNPMKIVTRQESEIGTEMLSATVRLTL